MDDFSIALHSAIHTSLCEHLLREDLQEDLCFALWNLSEGADRTTALIHTIVMPEQGDRNIHGNASFNPRYYDRVIGEARRLKSGIAFLHSHPSAGWQDMSKDDILAEMQLAGSAKAATDLPLVGMTLGTDGSWSGRFWIKNKNGTYKKRWCSNVRVVGKYLSTTFSDHIVPIPNFREELTRTVSSWGEKNQNDLSRLKIGVVGAGSVGSMVGESLARMGVSHIKILDFDTFKVHNLDRTLHAQKIDALLGRSKVDVLADGLCSSATIEKFFVDRVEYSVAEEEGYRKALDCDVLFSCVDRPLGRYVLNYIAYAHLIPVIDGGVKVVASQDNLKHADWRAHVVSPDRICLDCLGQYSVTDVQADKDGLLDDPNYIENLSAEKLNQSSENVFAFSLSVASLEILQFLNMILRPSRYQFVGPQIYHFVGGDIDFDNRSCGQYCLFPKLIGKGDMGVIVYGRHKLAEAERRRRDKMKSSFMYNWARLLYESGIRKS